MREIPKKLKPTSLSLRVDTFTISSVDIKKRQTQQRKQARMRIQLEKLMTDLEHLKEARSDKRHELYEKGQEGTLEKRELKKEFKLSKEYRNLYKIYLEKQRDLMMQEKTLKVQEELSIICNLIDEYKVLEREFDHKLSLVEDTNNKRYQILYRDTSVGKSKSKSRKKGTK